MERHPPADARALRHITLDADLCLTGGGLAGTCAAVTAARHGLKTVLIQDRPVLGGNASSEVRLWTLGATSHMSNNNRWSREGGVIDELLVENLHRNPEGNPILFDMVLLDWVRREPNLTLLLNTAAHDIRKNAPDSLESVTAFCPQNSTRYTVRAPLFCDASGDGVVGFLAGAAFRVGAEDGAEFGEKFAPDTAYGGLLGHTIYFYSKDTGRPVSYTPPEGALRDITQIPRYRSFNTREFGCRLWWIEYGGRRDTVHDTEEIKWELWKVVYGVWDYIKNSGNFPDAENLTLEWVGAIPGKRESRRFEGPHMLTQRDIVELRHHADAVAFGGWSIDLHPADGVYSPRHGCDQWHARGIFGIPYRCYFSRNIRNLFLAGRVISASHVAFGSTRVMATCAHGAQAVAVAAALCRRDQCLPADLLEPSRLARLQRGLLRTGQHIPGFRLEDSADLARAASIAPTSTLALKELPADGPWCNLQSPAGQWLPLSAGPVPKFTCHARAEAPATLRVQLLAGKGPADFTPDVLLAERAFDLRAGEQTVQARFEHTLPSARYVLLAFQDCPGVEIRQTQFRATGLVSVFVGKHWITGGLNEQKPDRDIGVESFLFWTPRRRPDGQNFALAFDPPLAAYAPAHLTNGLQRPTDATNAWAADPADPAPAATLSWPKPQTIRRVEVFFDPDYDHAMESSLMGHPERHVPFTVQSFRLLDEAGTEIAAVQDNHQARCVVRLPRPVTTARLTLACGPARAGCPPAVFEIRCYEDAEPPL